MTRVDISNWDEKILSTMITNAIAEIYYANIAGTITWDGRVRDKADRLRYFHAHRPPLTLIVRSVRFGFGRKNDLVVVNAYHAFGLPSLARWNRDRLPLCRTAELRPDITEDISWLVTARLCHSGNYLADKSCGYIVTWEVVVDVYSRIIFWDCVVVQGRLLVVFQIS